MKKIFIVLLMTIFSFILISCGKDEEMPLDNVVVDTNQPSNEENEPVSEATPEIIPNYPCVKPSKDNYKLGEDIPVNLYNTSNCKRVVLTEYGREPSDLHDITRKNLSEDVTEIVFNGTRIEKAGDYTIWLCGSSRYDYIYTYDIHIDDEDQNDYKITNAIFETDNIYDISAGRNVDISYVTIDTEFDQELTYRLYWSYDGVRLANYMALKTVISSGTNSFTISFPSGLYKPDNANQIEVAVVEGVSTSYYINVEDKIELEESEYEFTFNAISDLHIQSLQDSFLFNDHLKTALKDIYASDSKAILAVGDIVNNGKESEYEFFKTLYSEVENPNNVSFYPAIGNHEYMYFTDFNEPLGYFKKHHNLDSHYYSFEICGYKFIVLGTDTTSRYGYMNNDQLTWFENEINSVSADQPVFIALHQPLKDTVDGTLYTLYGQNDYGFIENNNRIRQILNSHPNAILFTGHSHHTLEGDLPVNVNTTGPIFANTGSMGYLNQFFGSDCESEIGGFEGLYIEVYKDYILIKGKEFGYNRWVANCQIKINRQYK